MNKDVWISVLLSTVLSIPVGILTGFLVGPLQRWYRVRGKSKAAARLELARERYSKVVMYHDNPTELTHFLLATILRYIESVSAWLLCTFLVAAGMGTAAVERLSVGSGKISLFNRILVIVYLGAGFIGSIASVAMFQITAFSFRNIWIRLKHFDQYVRHLPKEITEK